MYCSSCVSWKLSKSRRRLLRSFYSFLTGRVLSETFHNESEEPQCALFRNIFFCSPVVLIPISITQCILPGSLKHATFKLTRGNIKHTIHTMKTEICYTMYERDFNTSWLQHTSCLTVTDFSFQEEMHRGLSLKVSEVNQREFHPS